jgi:hypothetical protein
MTARPGGERLYRGILTLYPSQFRQRFGDEMVQLFEDRLRDARADHGTGGLIAAWVGLVADVLRTAPGEHLRRNRTVAHSLVVAPSATSRVLGLSGIVAGTVILAAYAIQLPEQMFFWRLIVFTVGAVAISVGVHLRQSRHAPTLSLAATLVFAAAATFFLTTVLFTPPGNIIGFWSGLGLWAASVAFGAASAAIGAVSRMGAVAVAAGSLLTLTGIDRLGLVSESSPTIFDTLSQLGVVAMAIGWIVLGIDVALRGIPSREAA